MIAAPSDLIVSSQAAENSHPLASKKPWPLAVGVLFLAVLWGRLFWSLAPEWKVDPQYAHGWFIPILAGILAFHRWQRRPAVEAPRGGALLATAAFIALLPLAPLAFLQAVYPEARPFFWAQALIVATVTVLLLFAHGGKGWARCFVFPILFALLAVPWPRAFQNTVTDRLMNGVAEAAVEVILLAGIPATQQGNTIALLDNIVGVDEACSGIRSLQGSIMVGLFLGAYFPLGAVARGVLLVLALAGSLVLNVVRATLLTWVSAQWGPASLDRLHDPAGLAILLLVFAGTLWAANLLSDDEAPPSLPQKLSPPFHPALSAIGLAGTVWLGGVDVASHFYYRAAEPTVAASPWKLDLHQAPGIAREEPISPTARQFLRYDSGEARTIRGENGETTRLIHLSWKGGEISAAGVRTHSPAICLEALGHRLEKSLPPATLRVHGVECVFNAYLFDVAGHPAYVYHAIWENGRAMSSVGLDQSLGSAIRAVRERRRLSEAKVLLIMLSGPVDAADAQQRLTTLMDQVLIVAPNPT